MYEPGSVFKVLTMAAALDSGTVTPDTVFVDTGTFEVGGYTIYNWDSGAWGPQTMLGCMQHSLNVCLSWVSSQIGAETFYSYLQAFGFGRPTGIDLAGEAYYPLQDTRRRPMVRCRPGNQLIRPGYRRHPHANDHGYLSRRQ